jgi:GT2 family glycosyltransferase
MIVSDVDVVILNYRTSELALQAAESAAREGADSICIVDNGSGDGSAARLLKSSAGFARVLPLSRNLGFAAGNNRGAGCTSRQLVLFMNADAELQPGSLKAMLRPFDDPAVGAVGPSLYFPDGREQGSAGLFPTPWRLTTALLHLDFFAERWGCPLLASNDFRRSGAYHGPVECLYGPCLLVRKAAFDSVGGFDETFFLYLDETDFFLRLRSAGWVFFRAADSHVIHHGGQSAKGIPVQSLVFMQQSRSIYGAKHFSRTARFYVAFISIIGNLFRLLIRFFSADERARYWAALGWWLGWTESPDPRKALHG